MEKEQNKRRDEFDVKNDVGKVDDMVRVIVCEFIIEGGSDGNRDGGDSVCKLEDIFVFLRIVWKMDFLFEQFYVFCYLYFLFWYVIFFFYY